MEMTRVDANGVPIDPYKAPKQFAMIAEYLKSKKSPLSTKEAIYEGKRSEYFKGKRAVDALFKNTQLSKKLNIKTKDEAKDHIKKLMENYNFFFRVEKKPRKTLGLASNQTFDEDAYYIWQWESPWKRMQSNLYSILLLVLVLAVVMFPLWPVQLRTGIWYLSMLGLGFVGALMVIAVIRLIVFVITYVLPFSRPGIWLFPNLFADVGIIDSFIPVWGWHGVNYEQMHLEKYKRQNAEKRKKKKSSKNRDGDSSTTNANNTAGTTDNSDENDKKEK